jgi:hypothetical protein
MNTTGNKPFSGNDIKYRGLVTNQPWSLCVGAGISSGIVPTWLELTRRVINSTFTKSYSDEEFIQLTKSTQWTLDALLQGASNYLSSIGESDGAFAEALENHIYCDFLDKCEKNGVKDAAIEALNSPRLLSKKQALSLHKFISTEFNNTSLVVLAKLISQAKIKGKAPVSVINFNADTLLYAVLDLYLIIDHSNSIGSFLYPKASFQKTLRGVDSASHHVTPIFHCHGAISPRSAKSNSKKNKDSREDLVFGESDYLEIAGKISTWSQSLFLYHAQCSRLLIIGHSMSDPNIRKWLAWSHNSSMKEISELANSGEITPRHIWINIEPDDKNQKLIQEMSLLHVGVRICWIDTWNDLSETLENLLAL